jgi:hypothetical protein
MFNKNKKRIALLESVIEKTELVIQNYIYAADLFGPFISYLSGPEKLEILTKELNEKARLAKFKKEVLEILNEQMKGENPAR